MALDREGLWAMQVFRLVTDEGSLAGAARALRMSPSAVSKVLAKLEARLGVELLRRTTRKASMTPAGERYRDHCVRVLGAWDEAEADLAAESSEARGTLRVSAPTVFGQEVVAVCVAAFVRAHPKVRVELELADRYVDLVRESFDLAVRIAGELPPSGLVARRVGVQRRVLCASPEYLADAPPLRRARDLEGHRCLELAHVVDRGRWELASHGRTTRVPVDGPVLSTNLRALYQCVLGGAGVARMPLYLVAGDLEAGRLVRVLPEVTLSRSEVFVVRASGRRLSASARALSSRIVEHVGDVLR